MKKKHKSFLNPVLPILLVLYCVAIVFWNATKTDLPDPLFQKVKILSVEKGNYYSSWFETSGPFNQKILVDHKDIGGLYCNSKLEGAGAKFTDYKDIKESELIYEAKINETLLLAGGLIVLIVIGFRGIRNIIENRRIEKNLNKELKPKKLKETMQKIWNETSPYIISSEREKAKAWLDDCLAKVDTGEFKTLKDFQTSLNAQVFKDDCAEGYGDINEKDIKNK